MSLYDIRLQGNKELSISAGINRSIIHQIQTHLPPNYNISQFCVISALTAVKQHAAREKPMVILWDEFQILVEKDASDASEVLHDVTHACRILIALS